MKMPAPASGKASDVELRLLQTRLLSRLWSRFTEVGVCLRKSLPLSADQRRDGAAAAVKKADSGLAERAAAGASLGLQDRREVRPAIGKRRDGRTGDLDRAVRRQLAAHPLVEETRGVVAQHPNHRRGNLPAQQTGEEAEQQLTAEASTLAIRCDIEGEDLA